MYVASVWKNHGTHPESLTLTPVNGHMSGRNNCHVSTFCNGTNNTRYNSNMAKYHF